jgi:hypothetical protein
MIVTMFVFQCVFFGEAQKAKWTRRVCTETVTITLKLNPKSILTFSLLLDRLIISQLLQRALKDIFLASMSCTVDRTPASYSIGPEFRSRIGNRVSWLVLLCPYSQTPRYRCELGWHLYSTTFPIYYSHIVLLRLGPRPFVTLRKRLIFYGEEILAPRPTPKLEDHPCA